MKQLDFEYGQGTMSAMLPDNTDVFIPGVTVEDPPCIPQEQLEAAYLESLAHPIGMPRVSELVHRGSKVVFVVPDRVKGGEQPTCHRKLSIHYILEELYAAGVNDSINHTDFMIGCDDLSIDGVTPDGNVVPIFRDGTWAF